jgi:dienelactone hydrolase
MRPFIEDRALLRRRLFGALDAARALDGVDSARIGAIGYCFGGLCVLELARSGADVRAVVSLHGMLHTTLPAAAGQVKASVLVLHGHEDPLAPPADLRALEAELTAAQVDWQVICYGHAAHAFTNPALNNRAGGMYHVPSADARSWRATLDHLHERLGT